MSQLPIKIPLELMQTRWASILNPVIALPTNSMLILKDISLNNGDTVINHMLGRMQQGWFLIDISVGAPVGLFRNAPLNDKTLTLACASTCTVSIGVF